MENVKKEKIVIFLTQIFVLFVANLLCTYFYTVEMFFHDHNSVVAIINIYFTEWGNSYNIGLWGQNAWIQILVPYFLICHTRQVT